MTRKSTTSAYVQGLPVTHVIVFTVLLLVPADTGRHDNGSTTRCMIGILIISFSASLLIWYRITTATAIVKLKHTKTLEMRLFILSQVHTYTVFRRLTMWLILCVTASYLWLNNARFGGQIANAKRSFVGDFYVAFVVLMFRKYVSVFILVYLCNKFWTDRKKIYLTSIRQHENNHLYRKHNAVIDTLWHFSLAFDFIQNLFLYIVRIYSCFL